LVVNPSESKGLNPNFRPERTSF